MNKLISFKHIKILVFFCVANIIFFPIEMLANNDLQLAIGDENGLFSKETTINVFGDELLPDGSKKIAPGKSGVYKFFIDNPTNNDADYLIKMSENMSYPIKYSIVLNETKWILGNENEQLFLTNSEQQLHNSLKSKERHSYTVYWSWPFEIMRDESDTKLGNNALEQTLFYELKFEFATSFQFNSDDYRLPLTGETDVILLSFIGILLMILGIKFLQSNRYSEN